MTQHLYATVINLTANNGGTIPEAHGRLVHGAFFQIMKTIDPALADYLHTKDKKRPFTLSLLQGIRSKRGQPYRIKAGQSAWLRFTLHHQQLFTTFSQYMLAPSVHGWPKIRLGAVEFTVREILCTPQSGLNWAGFDTVQSIQKKWHTATNLPSKIRVNFASPTAFSTSDEAKKQYKKWIDPIPMPEFLFSSLVSKWKDPLGLTIEPSEMREYARQTVVVSHCKLQTEQNCYHRHVQIGSVGNMTYELLDTDNQEMMRLLNLLTDLAFYSGVGHKTTQGMGMTRRVF